VPEKVVQRRLHQCGIHSVPQLLVTWSGLDSDLATWEDEVSIKQRFPAAPARGHAGTQEGGVVSSPHPGEPGAIPRPKQSKRPKKPSVRLAGPEWACSACEAKSSVTRVK